MAKEKEIKRAEITLYSGQFHLPPEMEKTLIECIDQQKPFTISQEVYVSSISMVKDDPLFVDTAITLIGRGPITINDEKD